MSARSDERYLATKITMMPRDTNPHGTIFGGVILSHIDQSGAIGARHAIRQEGFPDCALVTVAMNRVEFHYPVYVGDVVSFYSRVQRFGEKSITVHVSVEAERDGSDLTLTEAEVTYVAVELVDGRPQRPIPIRGE